MRMAQGTSIVRAILLHSSRVSLEEFQSIGMVWSNRERPLWMVQRGLHSVLLQRVAILRTFSCVHLKEER